MFGFVLSEKERYGLAVASSELDMSGWSFRGRKDGSYSWGAGNKGKLDCRVL